MGKFIGLIKAHMELNKHKKDIDRYKKAWEKIKKEQKQKKGGCKDGV